MFGLFMIYYIQIIHVIMHFKMAFGDWGANTVDVWASD